MFLDLKDIQDNFHIRTNEDYMAVALLGTVKGEHQARQHLLPTASTTRSVIKVRKWICQVIAANFAQGQTSGPALCNTQGRVLTSHDMNEMFHDNLCKVFDYNPLLFLVDIRSHQDLFKNSSVFRSFCHGFDSRAIHMDVKAIRTDVVDR